MLSTVEIWLFIGTSITSGCSAYFGSYLKKKGESLATSEDFQQLVDQVKATTEVAKAIEARITDQFLNKQRVWEMKRDLLFESVTLLGKLEHLLEVFSVIYRVDGIVGSREPEVEALEEQTTKEWDAAWNTYVLNRTRAFVIFTRETNNRLFAVQRELQNCYEKLVKDRDGSRDVLPATLLNAMKGVFQAVRKELGIDEDASYVR